MHSHYPPCVSASSIGAIWFQLSLPLAPACVAPALPPRGVCVAVRSCTERPPHARGLNGAQWITRGTERPWVLRARWASTTGRGRACRIVRRRSCSRSPLRCGVRA
jgi:hypothetical protein